MAQHLSPISLRSFQDRRAYRASPLLGIKPQAFTFLWPGNWALRPEPARPGLSSTARKLVPARVATNSITPMGPCLTRLGWLLTLLAAQRLLAGICVTVKHFQGPVILNCSTS